jgi:hypothetical protein
MHDPVPINTITREERANARELKHSGRRFWCGSIEAYSSNSESAEKDTIYKPTSKLMIQINIKSYFNIYADL